MPKTESNQSEGDLTREEDTWARSFHQELGLPYSAPSNPMEEPDTSSETQLLDILFEGACLVDDPQIVAERLTARIIELSKDADASVIARITQMLSDLGSLNNDVLKKAVPVAIKAVHATLVYPESVRSQNAAGAGDVVRVPSEVTTHLLTLIRNETRNPDLDPTKAALLGEIGGQVKDQILSHKLLMPEIRVFLRSVIERLQGGDLGDLADQTRTLLGQLGKSNYPPLTRLHDAMYSRVLESSFIADLVHDTPQPVLDSVQSMKDGICKVISIQTSRVQERAAILILNSLSEDERFWMPECPELLEFVKGPREEALSNLDKFMTAPTRNGYDAIAVPLMIVKATGCLEYALTVEFPEDRVPLVMNGKQVKDFAAYIEESNQEYLGILKEANRTNVPEDPKRSIDREPPFGRTDIPKNAHAGITLGYQPASVTFEENTRKIPSSHPAEVNLPKLRRPSQSQAEALVRGIPFVSGVSGSTSLNLYFLHYLRETSADPKQVPDPRDYMLANTMFMNYDGGHSIHEVLWVGQKLDGKLGLGLGLAKTNPDGTPFDALSYVSDLNEFIDLYAGTETGQSMQRARESAFDATLDYFEEHSSYAADKPVTNEEPAATEQHGIFDARLVGVVFEEAGINASAELRNRLEEYASIIAETEAMPGTSDDNAGEMNRNLKGGLQGIAREVFETQSADPRFTEFLNKAAAADPHTMEETHKELLVFLSQNLQTLDTALKTDVEDLSRQQEFGILMSEAIDKINKDKLVSEDKQKLDEIQKKLNEYRAAVAERMALAKNSSDKIGAVATFGSTVDSTAQELSSQSDRARNAVSRLVILAREMIRKHLALSKSAPKTLKWVAMQPWAKLVEVSIDTTKGDFKITTRPRQATVQTDTTHEQPDLTRGELSNTPELVFNGLCSTEMIKALTITPTGEQSQDQLPVVVKPDALAIAWGESLAQGKENGQDADAELPDFMVLKQVRYYDVEKGIFSDKKTLKTTWVVEQVSNLDTISEVNLLNSLPVAIAGGLSNIAENMNDLANAKADDAKDIVAKKESLESFLSAEREGLLKHSEGARDAMNNLCSQIMGIIQVKVREETSIDGISKWIAQQTWATRFDVAVTSRQSGAKGECNIVVKLKADEGTTEEGTAVLNSPAGADNAAPYNTGDSVAPPDLNRFRGLDRCLRALLNPAVHNQMVTRPTGETNNGRIVVEEPSTLAKDWASVLRKDGYARDKMPGYMKLQEVTYRSTSLLPWKRNKLTSCWVLEFDVAAFKRL